MLESLSNDKENHIFRTLVSSLRKYDVCQPGSLIWNTIWVTNFREYLQQSRECLLLLYRLPLPSHILSFCHYFSSTCYKTHPTSFLPSPHSLTTQMNLSLFLSVWVSSKLPSCLCPSISAPT